MDTSASADATATPPVRLDRVRGVGWLIFNRPPAGNAMNAEMMALLPEAWRELDADPSVRVIVVTGAGHAFQTGLDVKQLSGEPEALREMSRRTKRADLQLTGWHLGVRKPIVTAVNGVCAGGGLHFVADSDIVIAASTATFLDPHVSLGQVSAFESVGLAGRTAFGDVARMALTGTRGRVSAARAYQLGWVSAVIDPPDGLRSAAQSLAERMSSNDAAAMTETKRALWRTLETGRRAAYEQALMAARAATGPS